MATLQTSGLLNLLPITAAAPAASMTPADASLVAVSTVTPAPATTSTGIMGFLAKPLVGSVTYGEGLIGLAAAAAIGKFAFRLW